MKKICIFFLFFSPLYAALPCTKEEREELSKSLAALVWVNLQQYAPYYDFTCVIKELQALHEQNAKLSSDYQRILLNTLEKTALYEAALHLEETEKVLNSFSENSEMVELATGKLYYEKMREGKGRGVVKPHSSPTFCYKKYLFGEKKPTSQSSRLSLDETLKGFSMGVEGMRLGEMRRLYIHPKLAYGELVGGSPQQIVVIEVEVIAL